MFFIQFDEDGNISATVNSDKVPVFERQLKFDEYIECEDCEIKHGELVKIPKGKLKIKTKDNKDE